MSITRYREARTLVRRLCRMPGEATKSFKAKISRLREHFAQFNEDAAGVCQWLFTVRKQSRNDSGSTADVPPESFGVLGDFLLEPTFGERRLDEKVQDRLRLQVFDHAVGISELNAEDLGSLPEDVRGAANPDDPTFGIKAAARVLDRLRGLDAAHRMILLKSASEWVIARYRRGMESRVRAREEWDKEKRAWEREHPELTPEIQARFTDVFKSLVWDETRRPGVRGKRARICPLERIEKSENPDNCIFAGQKGHGPLCWKYAEFLAAQKENRGSFNAKYFPENVKRYLSFRRKEGKAASLSRLFAVNRNCKAWFESAWTAYLNAMDLSEATLIERAELPHCEKIGGKFEESTCRWNPHTELCRSYARGLARFAEEERKLEPLYREWRRDFLSGPAKPVFQYPSSRGLPMPKVFGEGWHELDLEKSIVRLRLEGPGGGEWLEFGFIPWPRGYRPSRAEAKERITSVHVNFIGSRARAGFRFDAAHAASRFACMQDEIDELRGRRFPRAAQDGEFLTAARERLVTSFSGEAEREMRVLAVDLGENGASAAVYQGRKHERDVPLEIIKIDHCYDVVPTRLSGLRTKAREFETGDPRGLRKEHVGRHLKRMGEGAEKVAEHRSKADSGQAAGLEHDFRGLKRHTAWMIRDWVRHNAARVIAAAEEHRCDLIVFESMRGWKAPAYDQVGEVNEKKKRWLAMFACGRIRRKATEKAVERGMRTVTSPYRNSSRMCSACGHYQEDDGRWRTNKRKEKKFKCECGAEKKKVGGEAAARGCKCRVELNSDMNAARVIARVFWGEIVLPERKRN